MEWLLKPFADVVPKDIERYVADRLEQEYAPATVDRELDLLSQVVHWAIKTLRIHIAVSPMLGVRRPRYFNERNRRLTGNEEARLMAAAREQDRRLAYEAAVETVLGLSE
ncbi:MAG: hypothetical protein M0R74_13595 [Dehalococcoidia bacterium]|nr:hypothetical protein [Dehalococcoidia bacterium]